jgi:hypothetical protein
MSLTPAINEKYFETGSFFLFFEMQANIVINVYRRCR